MWSTAHGYYSAGAGHSVALKQFILHSRTYEERDLFISKNMLYKTYLYSFNVAYGKKRYKKI